MFNQCDRDVATGDLIVIRDKMAVVTVRSDYAYKVDYSSGSAGVASPLIFRNVLLNIKAPIRPLYASAL